MKPIKSTFKKGETVTAVNLNHTSLFISALPSGRSEFILKVHRHYYRADVDKMDADLAAIHIWLYSPKHPTRSRYASEGGVSLLFCKHSAVLDRETVLDRGAIEIVQSVRRKYPAFF